MKMLWKELRPILNSIGFNRIHAFMREDQITLIKFLSSIGFVLVGKKGVWVFMEASNA